tara:strand:- start:134 stop:238 length:105 start_codon:yes stop_codon:yes gene_type:complete
MRLIIKGEELSTKALEYREKTFLVFPILIDIVND